MIKIFLVFETKQYFNNVGIKFIYHITNNIKDCSTAYHK